MVGNSCFGKWLANAYKTDVRLSAFSRGFVIHILIHSQKKRTSFHVMQEADTRPKSRTSYSDKTRIYFSHIKWSHSDGQYESGRCTDTSCDQQSPHSHTLWRVSGANLIVTTKLPVAKWGSENKEECEKKRVPVM